MPLQCRQSMPGMALEPQPTWLVSGALPWPGAWFLTCLDGGPHAVFRLERSHGLPSATPQRMGRLQGLAGPTAANLWPSTYFSFWKLARNVWSGDRDLGRRGQAQNKACCGTVSPRTELMQLDGAVLSFAGVPCLCSGLFSFSHCLKRCLCLSKRTPPVAWQQQLYPLPCLRLLVKPAG